jgi:hypothetical protein
MFNTLRTDWIAVKARAGLIWDKLKAFFARSETIFLARLESLTGLAIAGVNGIDWTAITSMDFTNAEASRTALITGLGMFVHGLVMEAARRRGTNL